ncbi:hypothetical protein B0H19DRAFT_1071028 [Mycena capillaripes]|nr:hypothetical protein B0H19DRAFT_1071028 [Mycena capillaripes]
MQFATSQPSVIGMRATATAHHIFLSLPNLARQLCTGRSTSPSLPPPMDYEFAEFTSHSSFSPLESDSHSSGMFSGAQNLTVSGQTLTNITNYTTPGVPSDFRMVPLVANTNGRVFVVYTRRDLEVKTPPWAFIRDLAQRSLSGVATRYREIYVGSIEIRWGSLRFFPYF